MNPYFNTVAVTCQTDTRRVSVLINMYSTCRGCIHSDMCYYIKEVLKGGWGRGVKCGGNCLYFLCQPLRLKGACIHDACTLRPPSFGSRVKLLTGSLPRLCPYVLKCRPHISIANYYWHGGPADQRYRHVIIALDWLRQSGMSMTGRVRNARN